LQNLELKLQASHSYLVRIIRIYNASKIRVNHLNTKINDHFEILHPNIYWSRLGGYTIELLMSHGD